MLNKVALDLWIFGEDGNGLGVPRNAFFTPDPTDDIQKLRQIGRKDGIIWAGSDLKPGKFLFSDCNNFIRSETGYTPHQLVYGSTSGLPGIFQLPRNADTGLGGSIYRLMTGIHRAQERGAPIPMGVNFPYEPSDQFFLLFVFFNIHEKCSVLITCYSTFLNIT